MSNTLDFQSLVQAAGDAIIAADRDGNIVLWNLSAERIFGFKEEEVLGRPLDLIIPERLRKRHQEGYMRVMQTGQTRYGTEVLRVPAVHKNGNSLSIAFSIAMLQSQEGEIRSMVAIIRDETARWQEERALRKRLAELEALCGSTMEKQ